MSSGSENRQRTACLHVRLHPAEADAIREKAQDSGVPVSEFMRCAALGRKTRSAVDSEMIRNLNRIGAMLRDQFNRSGGQYADESAAALREITAAIARLARDGELL